MLWLSGFESQGGNPQWSEWNCGRKLIHMVTHTIVTSAITSIVFTKIGVALPTILALITYIAILAKNDSLRLTLAVNCGLEIT